MDFVPSIHPLDVHIRVNIYNVGLTYLQVSKFGKGIDNDTEDDVQTNSSDEDEEGQMKYDKEAELDEGILGRVADQVLYNENE